MAFPVDRLSVPGLPGQLGLGFAPGRRSRHEGRNLQADLESLRQEHGFSHLVCFLEAHEMTALGIPDLLAQTRAAGLAPLHVPIEDGGTPGSMESMAALTAPILGWLATGEDVFLHCWAGLGRTGTVAAACLVAQGLPADEALLQIRSVRPGSVETTEQEAFLHAFARWRAGAQPGDRP